MKLFVFNCFFFLQLVFIDCYHENMTDERVALVTGYTGESGKALLKELLTSKNFKKVILVGRRLVDLTDQPNHEKTEQRQIDFEKIDEFAEQFQGADVHFCCLGTTRGKAGAEGFRRVDFDYVVNSARLAKQNGCKHFHLVSSQSANVNAFLLYPKVKGEAEAALIEMAFPRLSIYRPAFLMVDRVENRPVERFARTIIRYTIQRIAPQWITTPIEILARAMTLNTFTKNAPNVEILENRAIFQLAESKIDEQRKSADEL